MKDCPKCQGTGFKDGKICSCITSKKDDDLPDVLKEMFGDIFNSTGPDKGHRDGKGR